MTGWSRGSVTAPATSTPTSTPSRLTGAKADALPPSSTATGTGAPVEAEDTFSQLNAMLQQLRGQITSL